MVGIPVILAVIWLGFPWLTLLLVLVGVAAIRELYQMTPIGVGRLPVWLGAGWIIALILGAQVASGLAHFLIISVAVITTLSLIHI